MKKRKKLRLHRETLQKLTPEVTRRVVGGTVESVDYCTFVCTNGCPQTNYVGCNDLPGTTDTGGTITVSVPFCQTIYPNTCG